MASDGDGSAPQTTPKRPISSGEQMWRWTSAAFQPALVALEAACTPFTFKPAETQLPGVVEEMVATSVEDVEAALVRLGEKKDEWVTISTDERAKLLRACLDDIVDVAKEAADVGTRAHGSYGVGGSGEELANWTPIILALNSYEAAMHQNGQLKPVALKQRSNGQYVADIFPQGLLSLLFGSLRGEVWIEPGKLPTQGKIYREKQGGKDTRGSGKISLVLGAGNHVNIVVLDVLHKLLVEDEIVIAKMNPVNAFMGPYVIKALRPFHARGFLEVVYGGADVGSLLCKHPNVASVHLTGAEATFNAIVWGGRPDPSAGMKPVDKVVTGELGCVTPCLIFPGQWTEKDLNRQATNVASAMIQNCSHNCCAVEIIVTSKEWSQREQFVSCLRQALAKARRRVAWYPRSQQRYQSFFEEFPNAERLGVKPDTADDPTSPWGFISGLSPDEAQTHRENWCGVLQEVCLPGCGEDPDKFREAAVRFSNEKCWGTLSCCVFVDPQTQQKSPSVVDRTVEELKYGTIVINGPAFLGFGISMLAWGAYPGNTLEDIGSGNCFVHNTCLFDHPQKSVLYAPWQFRPKPFWQHSTTNLDKISQFVMEFLANPSFFRALKVILPLSRSET